MKAFSTAISASLVAICFFSSINNVGTKDRFIKDICLKNPTVTATKKYLSAKSLIIPVVLIDYGFATLKSEELQELNKTIAEEVTEDAGSFKTKVDDYLKYAPATTVYLLNAVGIKGRHKILDRTIILGMSSILVNQVVTFLKHSTHQLRPDGSTYNSFPSGHTATAFVGSRNDEPGIWLAIAMVYGVAGYSMAHSYSVLRVMNNRHWLSECDHRRRHWNSYNQIQLLALQQLGKQEARKATGVILTLSQAFYLQPSIKQRFNTAAGTVFALRLSISYFYIYLNA